MLLRSTAILPEEIRFNRSSFSRIVGDSDSHTTTLADEYAKRGQDWETQLRQRAKEIALMSELGLATESVTPTTNQENEDVQDEEVPADDA